jgi:glucan 1,3-beta-glucosidase
MGEYFGLFTHLLLTHKKVWTADHDMEDPAQGQTSVFSGRGILSESQGPIWLIGTASEHSALYQYSLVNAKNHYMGLIQTETPYYQPTPAPPAPFSIDSSFHDPSSEQNAAWGLWVDSSFDIFIFGAGHYSFFQNYDETCLNTTSCQSQIVNVDSASSIQIYQLATVGVVGELSVDQQGELASLVNSVDNALKKTAAVISASANVDGIQSTVTVWTSS